MTTKATATTAYELTDEVLEGMAGGKELTFKDVLRWLARDTDEPKVPKVPIPSYQ